jgi:hypothetical protein
MIRHERTGRSLSHHMDLHLSDPFPYNKHRYKYACIAMYMYITILLGTCMHTAYMRCISNPYR